MTVIYDELNSFGKYAREFKRYPRVVVQKTKYSIKLDFGNKKVLLRKQDGAKTNILGLINKVKNDVTKYINKEEITRTKSSDIFWYYYNDCSGVGNEPFEVAKIDLTSAYWTKGINRGIISKETNDYFNRLKFKDVKEKKSARLKAFGSLATVKSTEVYEFGKRNSEFQPLIMNENFRSVYMGICNEVAEDMQTVMSMVNGVYYYWDMIFVPLECIKQVGDIFSSMGYNFTVEKDIAEVFQSKNISYLYCHDTDIQYPIKN